MGQTCVQHEEREGLPGKEAFSISTLLLYHRNLPAQSIFCITRSPFLPSLLKTYGDFDSFLQKKITSHKNLL
jgi:hypothetical protein